MEPIVIALPEALTLLTLLVGAVWWVSAFYVKFKRLDALLTNEFGGLNLDGSRTEGRLYKKIGEIRACQCDDRKAIKRLGKKTGINPYDSDGPYATDSGIHDNTS